MRFHVRHQSIVTYAAPVSLAEFNLRLLPIDWPGQTLGESSLIVTPHPSATREASGPYPAKVTHIAFAEPLSTLETLSEFTIEVDHAPPSGPSPSVVDLRALALKSPDLSNRSPVPYLFASRIAGADFAIGQWALSVTPLAGSVIDAARGLNSAIHRQFAYRPGTTTSATPPAAAFAAREGVCQDFAHVMIVGLRALGIPAAYISGYLRTLPPPGGVRLIGADAMHAWVAVWCGPAMGWVGFDPTNDCLTGNDHIVVAMGRDYADVSPIDGVFVGNAPQAMTVMVDVTEI
jgi:transglutaminase-like putative cysteine protease